MVKRGNLTRNHHHAKSQAQNANQQVAAFLQTGYTTDAAKVAEDETVFHRPEDRRVLHGGSG